MNNINDAVQFLNKKASWNRNSNVELNSNIKEEIATILSNAGFSLQESNFNDVNEILARNLKEFGVKRSLTESQVESFTNEVLNEILGTAARLLWKAGKGLVKLPFKHPKSIGMPATAAATLAYGPEIKKGVERLGDLAGPKSAEAGETSSDETKKKAEEAKKKQQQSSLDSTEKELRSHLEKRDTHTGIEPTAGSRDKMIQQMKSSPTAEKDMKNYIEMQKKENSKLGVSGY